MKVEMVMPQMGESIAEGTILKWLKKEGDVVEKDENVLEISTDKVDSEIPSPSAGRIVALLAAEGETVPVGKPIAQIETDAAIVEPSGPTRPQASATEAATPSVPSKVKAAAPARSHASVPAAQPLAPPTGSIPPRENGGRFYSPLVRSIAQAEGIPFTELGGIPGSGSGGRLTKDDLMAWIEQRKGRAPAVPRPQVPATAAVRVGTGTHAPPESRVPMSTANLTPSDTRATADGAIDVIPMDHVRQRIAEHMVRSKATSPHVASVTEAEMSRVVQYRESNKEVFERAEGFKLTYTPFFVAAAVRALKEFPFVNASIDGTNILVKRFINIGLAVSTEYGLIVPVIHGADTLSFLGLARAVNDLAARARARSLKPEEVTSGTFSITNMGTVGTLFGIPIIAQPQVAILGVGSIQKRAVVRDDAIAIRNMLYLSLSYDHRIIDGAMGGAFVERVAHHLETMEMP